MPTPYSVAVIVGSLRKESFSLKIANALDDRTGEPLQALL